MRQISINKLNSFPLQRVNQSKRSWLSLAINKKAWIGLVTALTLIVIEGAIRKWVIGSEGGELSYFVFFSKDVAFGALILLPAKEVISPALIVFRKYLLYGISLLAFGAFISSTQEINYVGAALTLRSIIALPLLIILIVPRIKGITVNSIALVLALFTIANCILAVFQYNLPPDHLLNRYVVTEASIVYLEAGVRATGTFSYITGLSVMSAVGIWSGMTLLSLGNSTWYKITGWVAIISGLGCALTSMSRSASIIGILMLAVWLFFSRSIFSSILKSTFAAALVLVTLLYFGLIPIFTNLTDNLLTRHQNAGDTIEDRVVGQIIGELIEAIDLAPFGNGFGTEQVGGNYAVSGEMKFSTFETQFGRLVMESGIIGCLGFLVICFGAIMALQILKQGSITEGEKSSLRATQIFLVAMFSTNVVFNHTASAFVWMILAVVLVLSNGDNIPENKLLDAEIH